MINKPDLNEGDLKPCPFCGGEASVSEGAQDGLPFFYIECDDCAAMNDSVTGWNKRAAPPEEERLKAIAGRLNGIANAMASVAVYPNAAQLTYWREAVEEAYDLARGVRDPQRPPQNAAQEARPPVGEGPSPTVLMPREATAEMIAAAHATHSAGGIQRYADTYRAMVQVGEVPSPPQGDSR